MEKEIEISQNTCKFILKNFSKINFMKQIFLCWVEMWRKWEMKGGCEGFEKLNTRKSKGKLFETNNKFNYNL